MSSNRYEMDMTQGTLLPQILRFSVPLILTNVLQILYSAVDVAVVGRFASAEAMAAVSSSSSLIALMTKIFIGLSLGANVLVAQAYGSGNHQRIRESVHTSMLLSLLSGGLVMAVGLCLGRPMLTWMNTPDDVLPQATLYVQIYFSGSVFNMVYNYGAAVMRAVGDTKRPMYYLLVCGAVKVILNVLFVAGLGMDVAGVALATVISQLLSAGLILRVLVTSPTAIRLDLHKLRLIPRDILAQLKIGIPEGIQKAMFSISNVLLQSAVNTFGAIAMAGGTDLCGSEQLLCFLPDLHQPERGRAPLGPREKDHPHLPGLQCSQRAGAGRRSALVRRAHSGHLYLRPCCHRHGRAAPSGHRRSLSGAGPI